MAEESLTPMHSHKDMVVMAAVCQEGMVHQMAMGLLEGTIRNLACNFDVTSKKN